MQKGYDQIDKILPYGELMRGFANQSCISKADLKRSLRERGIFFNQSEREIMVPCIATLLLSPSEFDNLRDTQNTREDNLKKSSSRIEWISPLSLIEAIPEQLLIEDILPGDSYNYNLTTIPEFTTINNDPNKILLEFEIERYDWNKSWFESKNNFNGSIFLQKINDNELQIIKSFTSNESRDVSNKIQNLLVKHFKETGCIPKDKKLNKILFGDFSNEDRIVFFWRLTTNMDSIYFTFVDIQDMEFRPDESKTLPDDIQWMYKKKELKLKGSEIHNTFFIKEREYHQYLQFWSLESKFDFNYHSHVGSFNATFSFRDFLQKGDNSEFEINISGFNIQGGSTLSSIIKNNIKHKLLELLEDRKNEIYSNFQIYLSKKSVPVE